jgi:phage-related protein
MEEIMKKELEWVGASKKDLLNFPLAVRKEVGHALYIAQEGGKHKSVKALKGFVGAKVFEIVLNDVSGTYRAMYTIEFEEVIYVLHAFQKKSKTGIKTDKSDMDLVEQRLKKARQLNQERQKSQHQGKKYE